MSNPQQQSKPALQFAPTTVFVLIDDIFEEKIAQAYLKAKYKIGEEGGSEARRYKALPLNRLRREDTVIAVLRPEKRKPALRVKKNEHGIKETTDVPLAELITDCFESKPLPLAQFWREGLDGYDGDLDHHAFMCALGPLISPAAIAYNEKQLPGYMSIRL